ncbi:MAG: hypothetical protein RMA76_37105 [Deltaproteobacteria bacterium]|jgi:hypothetical protein
MLRERSALFAAALLCACSDSTEDLLNDAGPQSVDAAVEDGGTHDAGATETPRDGGVTMMDAGARETVDVLFVGNSYTTSNDVAGLTAAQLRTESQDVRYETVAPGGRRLEQHAADARTDGTALTRWLRTGSAEETAFDAVVLQEQSQIGGFPVYAAERRASIDAAIELTQRARDRGARVVLYMTWGRARGDAANAIIGYGTFLSMQALLDEGYVSLATYLEAEGFDVAVAPVGGGFRIVYEDVLAAGQDPLDADSDFIALYQEDGSHPSERGAYLAACILARTIDPDLDPSAIEDHPNLGPNVSSALRDVCHRAIHDRRWRVPTLVEADAELRGNVLQGEQFGFDVALDGTGTRLLVGARGPAPDGSASVFVRDPDWREEVRWSSTPGFGGSVALDDAGALALVQSPWSEFERDDNWTSVVRAGAPTWRGHVRVSGDGTRVLVSRRTEESTLIAAHVLERDGEGWSSTPLDTRATSFADDASFALDTLGDRVVVAATGSTVAFVFEHDGSNWTQEVALKTRLLDGRTVDLNRVVAISGDGTRVFVGLLDHDAVITFERTGATWTERTSLFGPPNSRFGTSVATNEDGSRLLVGAPRDGPVALRRFAGSARVYEHDGVGFAVSRLLVPPPGDVADILEGFGTSIDLSVDGNVAAVGAPSKTSEDGDYAGAVYPFPLD